MKVRKLAVRGEEISHISNHSFSVGNCSKWDVVLAPKNEAVQMTVHKVPDGEQMPRPVLSKQAAQDVSVTYSNYYAENVG